MIFRTPKASIDNARSWHFYVRRLAMLIGGCLLIALLFEGWSYAWWHFKTESLDNLNWSPEAKDAYFAQAFPARSEIESYLSDATILKSHPPILNSATYFDTHRHFSTWEGNAIIRGSWYVEPIFLKLTRYDQSRFTIVYSLCRELEDGSLTGDNCYLVENRERIFSIVSGPLEYAKGDIFGLATLKKPPFALPLTGITFESLKAELRR